jgi:phosphate transport system ATP-binding protein
MNDIIRDARRGAVLIDGQDIYALGRHRQFAAARRDGVSEVNPFPKSIFDNVATACGSIAWCIAMNCAGGRSKPEKRRTLGRGARSAAHVGAGTLGRTAAASGIARALAISRDPAHGQPASALGDATQRIEELIYHLARTIDRHPQHAAGRARLGRHRILLARKLVECGRTNKIFTAPGEKLTEDYVTGRFG